MLEELQREPEGRRKGLQMTWIDKTTYWKWAGEGEPDSVPPEKTIEYENFGYQQIASFVTTGDVRKEVFEDERNWHRARK